MQKSICIYTLIIFTFSIACGDKNKQSTRSDSEQDNVLLKENQKNMTILTTAEFKALKVNEQVIYFNNLNNQQKIFLFSKFVVYQEFTLGLNLSGKFFPNGVLFLRANDVPDGQYILSRWKVDGSKFIIWREDDISPYPIDSKIEHWFRIVAEVSPVNNIDELSFEIYTDTKDDEYDIYISHERICSDFCSNNKADYKRITSKPVIE